MHVWYVDKKNGGLYGSANFTAFRAEYATFSSRIRRSLVLFHSHDIFKLHWNISTRQRLRGTFGRLFNANSLIYRSTEERPDVRPFPLHRISEGKPVGYTRSRESVIVSDKWKRKKEGRSRQHRAPYRTSAQRDRCTMHQALHFWHVFHMFEVRPCPQVAVRTVVVHSALASTVRDTGTLIKVRSTRDPLDTASQFSSAHSTVYCNPRPRSKFSKGGPRPPGPPPGSATVWCPFVALSPMASVGFHLPQLYITPQECATPLWVLSRQNFKLTSFWRCNAHCTRIIRRIRNLWLTEADRSCTNNYYKEKRVMRWHPYTCCKSLVQGALRHK